MEYAIVETGGKQYKVKPGQSLRVESLGKEKGQIVELDRVLFISAQKGKYITGHPYIEKAKVIAEVRRQAKAKKIIVFKVKRRKKYRRKYGHRQPYTELFIKDIIYEKVMR